MAEIETMDRKNILIVEDDEYSMKMLEKIIIEVDMNVKCYKADNLNQAYVILHEYLIDVFFIDIVLDTKVLGDASGMKLAEEIRDIERYKFTPILFITSLEDPMMYAFKELHSFDYITKPYLVSEAKKAIEQALCYKTEYERKKTIHFKKDGILVSLIENDIVYMKSIGRTLHVFIQRDEITIPYKTCDYMMDVLDERLFVQCNRNTIVNREYIESIDSTNRYIKLKNFEGNEEISIGKKYLNKVLEGMIIW